jgi:hypothetical protein
MEILIKVRVKPKSKKEYVKKISGDEYEVAVKELPEKGKANKRLVELLSHYFGISKTDVSIIKGRFSRIKMIKIRKE